MDYIITTPCGQLRGGAYAHGLAYKGIRYATAGRWEYPKLVTAWEGVYDATAYGNCSWQPRAFYDEEQNEKKYFYYHEFRKGETYTYSDDCLFLNIFTPENAQPGQRLPVLVYIHGGGFTGGCGHEKHFDGPVWPQHGIIGVTINYRLGPLGFASLPQLTEEAGHSGNYALYDQLTALQWVRDNIAAFGGDPGNITIMGQSAGAMSVQLLCQSPLTEGLFQRAVLSSGCGMADMMAASPEKAGAFWQAVMARCGCENLEQFRALPAETLFAQWQIAKKEIKGGGMSAAPVKDGLFLTGMAPREIPYMAGSTSHDMAPPVLFAMTRKWVSSRKAPSFVWFFDRLLPGDDCGAWHSADLWYWFGTLANCWRPMKGKDRDLSSQMVQYLCNFARNGNPNGEGLPLWQPAAKGQKQVLCLGQKRPRMEKPGMGKMIHTMLTNKAVGE